MRIMGLDYGQRRIGIAISDELLLTAQSHSVVEYDDLQQAIHTINKVAHKYQITKIVLGLPRNMDGSLGAQSQRVLAFKKKLQAELDLPVISWDERLTTSAAQQMLITADLSRSRRKRVVDKVAAALILQSFLDNLQDQRVD